MKGNDEKASQQKQRKRQKLEQIFCYNLAQADTPMPADFIKLEAEMDFSSINWLAIVVCVVVSMISGSLWYNPKTFFPAWWAVVGSGRGQPGMENMGMTWALTVLSSFVQAVAMAFMINIMGSTTAFSGAKSGLILWLGFIAPTYLVNKLFAGHGLKIWVIEAGNHLVNFVIFGAILGAWR